MYREKLNMVRNVWKLLHLSNPGDLYEFPEEDVSKYEDPMFKTKPFLTHDTLKTYRVNKYKSIIKLIYLKYTKQVDERAVLGVQRVQDQWR